MTHESEKCLQTHQQDSLVTPAVPAADVKVDFVCPEPMTGKYLHCAQLLPRKRNFSLIECELAIVFAV